MATEASITPPTTGKRPFTINGCDLFTFEEPGDYIRAAHGIAVFAGVSHNEHGEGVATTEVVASVFDGIALLLAHAQRLSDPSVAH